MDDLGTLRPEVQKALDGLSYFLAGTHNHNDFYIIRAELLRLAKIEEERWAVVATRNGALERAEKAEAELAALKARIAEAPTAIVGRCALNSSPEYNIVTACSPLDGKRVRLVVDNEPTGEHADSMEEWARRKVEE